MAAPPSPPPPRVSRWYFGGVASAIAVCITHPLDLVKVIRQTQSKKKMNRSLFDSFKDIVRVEGFLGLYNGLSASILRQLTYSTVRFGMYETGKQFLTRQEKKIPVYTSVALATVSGFCGGFCGNPADLVNVRMQNDMQLPRNKRRKHGFHGIYEIIQKEGGRTLFNGVSTNCGRAVLMTVGQLVLYDISKNFLHSHNILEEGMALHFIASAIAGAGTTTICQPMDVLKTRAMNAKPNEPNDIMSLLKLTYMEGGIKAFFKGYVPAFIRIGPQTIIVFMVLEQLRIHFGKVPKPEKVASTS